MLETEEVDIDYFTPASSTSLSKIFSNKQTEEGQENSSLKYVPPLPTQVTPKPDEEKSTQHVLYVMTINAYEWLKGSYVSKERVGFVIIKIIKSGLHNIILYDSNKTILSCLTLTSNTEVNVKENVSLSYYDNVQKYWSVYTTPYEINKIIDILKQLNVNLKNSDTRQDLCKNVESIKSDISKVSEQIKNDGKESDTDSSVNRRTKDSILKRMATMGQSVLPPTHSLTTQTSDSSDTNEPINQHKARHKPFKTINKRNMEKSVIEIDNNNDSQIKKNAPKPLISPDMNKPQNIEQRVVTIKTMDIVKSPDCFVPDGNDMNMFMSEQRVNNSELRINMSRITDKLDLMLDKVKYLENVDKIPTGSNSSQIQNEITYKLLNEYEKKIKNYEMFIRSKGFNCDIIESLPQLNNSHKSNYDNVPETILSCDCKELCKEKDRQITELKVEVQKLTTKLEESKLKDCDSSLTKEINELKEHIMTQKDQITNLNKKIEITQSNEDVVNKLKRIMNDTFQTVSENFDNDASYSGAMIKSTVASVIKKTTMDCLKEL